MAPTTESLIDIGLDHLGRFAFFTRDNPFLSSRATLELPPSDRRMLTELLDGSQSVADWRRSDEGLKAIKGIGLGALPRDVQVVDDGDVAGVGVLSMHGFLRAPLFWWLVSILWCISPGTELDKSLHEGIIGYRLHRRFRTEPQTSGLMFQDPSASYKRWQRSLTKAAESLPGAMLAATTLDFKDFYYRVQATPSALIRQFRSRTAPFRVSRRGRVLTALLDVLHLCYAQQDRAIKPRPKVEVSNAVPLPVGPPSSRILANLIMSVAVTDLERQPRIQNATTFADDLLIVSRVLPALEENNAEYLTRLGVIGSGGEARLAIKGTEPMGDLIVGLDKTGTSYSRAIPRNSEGERDEDEDEDEDDSEELPADEDSERKPKAPPPAWGAGDAYLEGAASPDWGGRLRTILRAPHKRARVPHRLRNDLTGLVDVIRVGIDQEDAKQQITTLIDELDLGLFLALRPYWTELLVAAIAANGPDAVDDLSRIFVRVGESLRLPGSSSRAAGQALMRGLRAAWLQAAALAVAVGFDSADREALARVGDLMHSDSLRPLTGGEVVALSVRMRKRRLVPGQLVSAPLAEFTEWPDRLIGPGAFGAFLAWAKAQASTSSEVRISTDRAVRFVPLHEACLAVHLRAAPTADDWLERAFRLVADQPLVEPEQVETLHAESRSVLDSKPGEVEDGQMKGRPLRFAMPSLRVPDNQLAALLASDASELGKITSLLRTAIRTIVNAAVRRRAHVLVLPEWSLLPEQLAWVMSRAADARMLTIGGQTPDTTAGTYANRIWTGVPIRDSGGHRACLVPPPRQKRYLSPHEQVQLETVGLTSAAEAQTAIPAYRWRDTNFASLICFEFADISTRQQLRAIADVITVSSLNMDWRYFDAVQDATTRDSYSLTVCVNTGEYPGTRIMRPTKSETSSVASVHGSDDPIVVTRVVDVAPIVAARLHGQRPDSSIVSDPVDGASLDDYKAYPPV